ncbi:aminoglycoside phosphotransferase family protein [Chloroflexi bacterium TSY]|nr:aminoglycoside phosphotransferase family protein [Chloroflexi bacterium TSY]
MHPSDIETLRTETAPLLAQLSESHLDGSFAWNDWQVQRITGGHNNLGYRITGSVGDLAVKLTRPDNRERATREYCLLNTLKRLGIEIAPRPLFLDGENFALSAVVQTWLSGRVEDHPPQSATEWEYLLQPLATIHAITPDMVSWDVPACNFTFDSPHTCAEATRERWETIPEAARTPTLHVLKTWLEETPFDDAPTQQTALCRADTNITNYVRQADRWLMVDWENSGWGNPIFDLADLMTHPAYTSVSESTWQQILVRYVSMRKYTITESTVEQDSVDPNFRF